MTRVRGWTASWPATVGVFVVGFGVRLAALLQSGGLHPNPGNDPSVYYAAADALIHGRLPYVDFVLLHPPLTMLLLTPFAALGAATADPVGWFLANLAGCVAGAVSAVLVLRIARRFGAARVAALAGGLWYAVFHGAVLGEHDARLEPFGNLFLLLGVLAAARAAESRRARPMVLSGAALAASVCVKIWYVVPAAAVLGWLLWRVRGRRWLLAAAGALGLGVLVVGPFFLTGPVQFGRMVFLEQVTRPARITRPSVRISDLFGAEGLLPHLSLAVAHLLAAVVLAALAVLAVAALRWPAGRLAVALLIAEVVTYLASPSWFSFYDAYPAVGVALTVALTAPATRRAGARTRAVQGIAWMPGAVALSLTGALFTAGLFVLPTFPGDRLSALLPASRGCVMSDEQAPLILMDRLSADLARGCPNWVDVSGHGYAYRLHASVGVAYARENASLLRYLRDGQAAIVVRFFTRPSLLLALARDGILARGRGYVVYRGTPPVSRPR